MSGKRLASRVTTQRIGGSRIIPSKGVDIRYIMRSRILPKVTLRIAVLMST